MRFSNLRVNFSIRQCLLNERFNAKWKGERANILINTDPDSHLSGTKPITISTHNGLARGLGPKRCTNRGGVGDVESLKVEIYVACNTSPYERLVPRRGYVRIHLCVLVAKTLTQAQEVRVEPRWSEGSHV